ncbi:MAG TPA: hypothetical protein VH109_01840 [Steroidobacteraceae bacterium]|jgi:hypothetical protein|nr:hypothetical protein [Steroidobacteraceae bacterium]
MQTMLRAALACAAALYVPCALAGGPVAPAAAGAGCLASGNGYLRATIRGAMNLDISWGNGELECEGGPRPDGSGLRLAFAGPPHADGRRVRLVFGVEAAREGLAGRDLPTNLTVIFEGEERLFSTRGDDHCTVDELRQERLGALGGPVRSWRIVARGFCVAPASSLDARSRILVSSFDFAGTAVFEDPPPEKPNPGPPEKNPVGAP